MTVPAKATSSTEGVVLLGGDITGTGESPQLIKSGVVPGTYTLTAKLSVDSKGRVTSAGELSQEDIDAAVDAAYASSPGDFTIVSGRPVRVIPDSTTSSIGAVQISEGFNIVDSVLSLKTATPSVRGAFIPGNGIKLNSGALDFDEDQMLTVAGGGVEGFLTPSNWQIWGNWPTGLGSNEGINFSTGTATNSIGYTGGSSGNASSWLGVVFANNGTTVVGLGPGISKGFAFLSTDSGQTWTKKVFDSTSIYGYAIRTIYWNGTSFIAILVDSSAAFTGKLYLATTTDGLNWTFSDTGYSLPDGNKAASFSPAILAFGKIFVFSVNASDKLCWLYSSDDGVTWTSGSDAAITLTSNRRGFVFDGTYLVGFDNLFSFRSTNGTTWTQTNLPTGRTFRSVATNRSGVVALSTTLTATPTSGAFYTSSNGGASWATATGGGTNLYVNTMVWLGNRFMGIGVPGTSKTMASNSGGTSWSVTSTSITYPIESQKFFQIGSDFIGFEPYVKTSDNGASWVGGYGITLSSPFTSVIDAGIVIDKPIGCSSSSAFSVGTIVAFRLPITQQRPYCVFGNSGLGDEVLSEVENFDTVEMGEYFSFVLIKISAAKWLLVRD